MFESLCAQTYRDFEVLVVDQNSDDRVTHIVDDYSDRLSLRHIQSAKGQSRGRNAALGQPRSADILTFPDDDCWYPPDLLERVSALLRDNPEWDGITGRSVAEDGSPSNGRWDTSPGLITLGNSWNRATTFTIFVRESIIGNFLFDESLGAGPDALWGGGEDLDFLLQIIRSGHPVHYDPTVLVHHPEWSGQGYTASVIQKAHSYGRGMGRVLRKHKYPLSLVSYHLVRPFGGTLLALATIRTRKARYHWSIFSGRLQGWLAKLPVSE